MDAVMSAKMGGALARHGFEIQPREALASLIEGDARRAVLAHGRVRADIAILYAAAPVGRAVRKVRTEELPLLVLSDWISERTAHELRALGVQYLDTAGNAYLTVGDAHVDVRGRRRPASQAVPAGMAQVSTRSTSLVSPARAQVVFALLVWPELLGGTVRQLATAAGVSRGQAHNTLVELRSAGYVRGATTALQHASTLLDLWIAAYPTSLGRKLRLRELQGDPPAAPHVPDDEQWYLGGEVAAGLRNPETLTLYMAEFSARAAIANRWSAGEPSNVYIRRKFWTTPGSDEQPGRLQTAPSLLTYADLRATGDARLHEVAEDLRRADARLGQIVA